MRELGIFPTPKNEEEERIAMEVDEFERGYPRLTLQFMMDVAGACLAVADSKREGREKNKDESVTFAPKSPGLANGKGLDALRRRIFSGPRPDSAVSWRGVLGRLPGLRKPHPGDVIVFIWPKDRSKDFIKRVIAVEGQTVEMRNKQVYIDGKFVGGCDIVREMHANGELEPLVRESLRA